VVVVVMLVGLVPLAADIAVPVPVGRVVAAHARLSSFWAAASSPGAVHPS
jgi:hypothetical protein